MSREEYMSNLKNRLASFEEGVRNEILSDYEEHFRMGAINGKSEDKICEELGSIDDLVNELGELASANSGECQETKAQAVINEKKEEKTEKKTVETETATENDTNDKAEDSKCGNSGWSFDFGLNDVDFNKLADEVAKGVGSVGSTIVKGASTFATGAAGFAKEFGTGAAGFAKEFGTSINAMFNTAKEVHVDKKWSEGKYGFHEALDIISGELEKLNSELSSIRSKFEDVKEQNEKRENEELEDALDDLEEDLDDIEDDLDEIEDGIDEVDDEIADLEEGESDDENHEDRIKDMIYSLKDMLYAAAEKLKEVGKQIVGYTDEPEDETIRDISGHVGNNGCDAVVIDAGCAKVNVHTTDGDEVAVTYVNKGTKNQQLAYKFFQYQEGTVFHAGVKRANTVSSFFGRVICPEIELDVFVPKNLDSVQVKTSSGSVSIDEAMADIVKVETVSGNIKLGSAIADVVKLGSVSGSINLGQVNSDVIDLKNISGSINLDNYIADKLHATNTSGPINVTGKSDAVDVKTVSGSINCKVSECDAAILGTVSGSLRLTLDPSTTGYRADVSTVSGSVVLNRGTEEIRGVKSGSITLGDGAVKVKVSTVSGSVVVNTAD